MGAKDRWYPLRAFVGVAMAVLVIATLSAAYLPFYTKQPVTRAFPDQPWLDAWVRWDSGWYRLIADRGYSLTPGEQSPVVFFPGYPLLMRLGRLVTGDSAIAGILITLAAGLGSAFLFHRWCLARLSSEASRAALLALLLYPFSFYLYGAVYSDALFLLASLAAFVFLERDRPSRAGVAGAVATATRLVGIAVAAGLWLRAIERKGMESFQGFIPAHLGLLLAPLGFVAYSGFLWYRFGDPFAYATAIAAPGWDQPLGLETWLKFPFFETLAEIPPLKLGHVRLLVHAGITLVALGLVALVFRRFGWAYGLYAFAVVAIPAISSKDFMGMGRYILAAFPCFGVVGDLLSTRPALMRLVFAASSVLLLIFTSLHARSYLIS